MYKISNLLLYLVILVTTLFINYPLISQTLHNKPRIYYYYPEHGSGGTSNDDYDSRRLPNSIEQGKWQIDTVECYVKKFRDTTIGGKTFDISDSVFTRAINEWNSSGMKLFLKIMPANSTDGRNSPKNIFCFGAEIGSNRDSLTYGVTQVLDFDTVMVNNVIHYIPKRKYVELSLTFWNFGELAWQGQENPNRVDVFDTGTHELGHFIGLGGHDYFRSLIGNSGDSETSIMYKDPTTNKFNGLNNLDKLYARSFYPNILPQHQNNCTPR